MLDVVTHKHDRLLNKRNKLMLELNSLRDEQFQYSVLMGSTLPQGNTMITTFYKSIEHSPANKRKVQNQSPTSVRSYKSSTIVPQHQRREMSP